MPIAPLLFWLLLLNLIGLTPYTDGPRSFLCLLASVLLLWKLPVLSAEKGSLTPRWLAGITLLFCALAAGVAVFGLLYRPDWLIDIGANTHAATALFADGMNPYTTRAQLWVSTLSAASPNVTVDASGQTLLFGLPYFHGFPYFPMMLLAYLPGHWLFDGYAAIRITHLMLIALNIAGFWLLIRKLVPQPQLQRQALLLTITAYLGVVRYTFEAVALGVTDILISSWLLYAFVALAHQRYLLCGLLLGCAQATKLLPAPFVLMGLVWMLMGRRELLPLLCGYLIASAALILPFLLWHPEGFISSTILYYLTHHVGGDITSLWFFLPKWAQSPFLIIGLVATVVIIGLFAKRGRTDLASAMAGAYASYAIFMAFSKMTHLNYLWGVLPLGCVALGVWVVGREYRCNPH
jgi:hypothetical protein